MESCTDDNRMLNLPAGRVVLRVDGSQQLVVYYYRRTKTPYDQYNALELGRKY